MNWVPVHERMKYLSLLNTKIVLWAYTASYKWVGGADSVRRMLDTHIINASVMFPHFQHEREFCNSDPVLWVDGLYIILLGVVTCHTNCASNICDHSASYFYSGVRDTPWQYLNIWDVIISHSHMHLYNTHLQCFQLLFQLSLLLPVETQLLPMLLHSIHYVIHFFLPALL